MEGKSPTQTGEAEAPLIDATKKFVRIDHVREDGFVAFDFAVGKPEYFAELLLPKAAFEEFCREHDAIVLDPRDPADQANEFEWGLRQAAEAAATGLNPGRQSDFMEKN